MTAKWKTRGDALGLSKSDPVSENVSSTHIRNTGRRKAADVLMRRACPSCCCRARCYEGRPEAGLRTQVVKCVPRAGEDRQPGGLAWLYMTVWVVSVVPYLNGLTGEFVHDDLSAVTSNPDVTGANPLYQVFMNDYWGKSLAHPLSHKSYRPLTILTFRLTHSAVGLSPAWYHVSNVALHALVCLLYARLVGRLVGPQAALPPALLFATHPVHTEAVTGIVGRADLLAAACLLLALLAYLEGVEDGTEAAAWGGVRRAAVWSLLGTLCKEPALTALLLCGVWDCCTHCHLLHRYFLSLWPERGPSAPLPEGGPQPSSPTAHVHRISLILPSDPLPPLQPPCPSTQHLPFCCRGRGACPHSPAGVPSDAPVQLLLRRLAWLALTAVAILALRLWMLRGSSPAFSDQDNPASFSPHRLTRLLTFSHLPALNFWLLLCPWQLCHDWQVGSVPLVTGLADARNLLTLAFYAALALLVGSAFCPRGKAAGGDQAVRMGLALLILPFLPASNLFFRVGFVLAERILYIPSMGQCLLVSVGLQRLQRLQVPALLCLLLLFSARTARRNCDWQSRASLSTAGLRTMPNNAKMHYNYANLQRDLANADLAEHYYREAIRLWPEHASAHNNLATLLNDSSEAELHFRAALAAHPHHPHASYNLAMLKQQQGAREEAVALLEASLRADISHRDSVCALADLYALQGRHAEAEALHRELLLTAPSDAVAHNNYAAFLQRAGRKEAALRYYEVALSLDPDHSVALVNTARLLRALKHDQHAETLYRRALSVSWEAGVGESLGKLYLNTDRLDEAHRTFTAVLHRFPHRMSTKVYLARVELQQRRYDVTESILSSVLSEDPAYPEALLQLSLLYAHTNRTEGALSVAASAIEHCAPPSEVCAQLLAHKADLLHSLHRTDAAQQSYEAALKFDSTLSHAHANLGAIFHSKGELAQAWHHYLSAQTHDPTNSLLLENMNKLRRSPQLMPPLAPLNCLTVS